MKIKIPSEIWVKLYSEIADAMVHSRSCNRIWVQDENGNLKYTDEAQEKFNKCAEIAEGMLEDCFIKGE